MKLTPEQEALKQAAQDATQGQWLHRHDPGNPEGFQHGVRLQGEFGMWVCDCISNADRRTEGGDAGERNASYIAAANPSVVLALLAQIEAMPEQWQPVDTAPKDLRSVWLGCPSSIRVGFWSNGPEHEHHGSIGGGWRDLETGRDLHFAPTSWMPVPHVPGSQA